MGTKKRDQTKTHWETARSRFAKLSVAVLLLSLTAPVILAQDPIDMVVPDFSLQNATMKEAARLLSRWGVHIGLEQLETKNTAAPKNITLTLKNKSVDDILSALVEADPRYEWRRYRKPHSGRPTRLVNIFPLGIGKEPSYVMNHVVEQLRLKGTSSAANIIRNFRYRIPGITYIPNADGVPGSVTEIYGGLIQMKIEFEFTSLTVRAILNEITLVTPDAGWVYETTSNGEHHWDVLN